MSTVLARKRVDGEAEEEASRYKEDWVLLFLCHVCHREASKQTGVGRVLWNVDSQNSRAIAENLNHCHRSSFSIFISKIQTLQKKYPNNKRKEGKKSQQPSQGVEEAETDLLSPCCGWKTKIRGFR
ncbi:hypothetical protein AAC387_Pa05g0522 [Persea americana]